MVYGEVVLDHYPDGVRLGGSGLNTSVSISRKGVRPVIYTSFGEEGAIVEFMRREGIEYVNLVRRPRTIAVVVNLRDGVPEFKVDYDNLRTRTGTRVGGIVHITGPGVFFMGPPSLEQDSVTSLDPNVREGLVDESFIRDLGELISITDILSLNESEEEWFKSTTIRPEGRVITAVRLGASGVRLRACGSELEVSGFPVVVKDTTGAGDAWNGTFLWALSRGFGLKDSALLANASAALKVTSLGAVEGSPGTDDLARFLRERGDQDLSKRVIESQEVVLADRIRDICSREP